MFMKIRRDIRSFVFIVGVVDTSDKLFNGVNSTGDKLSLASLLQAVYYCKCMSLTLIRPCPVFS
jgi:hypothetical protein